MLGFVSREGSRGLPAFDAAHLDIHGGSFAALAASNGLDLPKVDAPPDPRLGGRVRAIYLNDPELQKIYPLGLLPLGQLHFLGWLTTHGRADQSLTDAEIFCFLHQSARQEVRGLCLTYLIQPSWQEHFPWALTGRGWSEFRAWINATYGEWLSQPLPPDIPDSFPGTERPPASASLEIDGVNILSHFCNPSGIQQAAIWTKTALERAGLRTSCRDVPVPRRIVPTDREEWLGLEIFPVTILTHAAVPYFESGYERSGLLPRENVYRIAYWAWELETVPDEWVEAAQLVDEIWAPTEFVAAAMRARMPRPVYKMPPGVEIGPKEEVSRAKLGIPEGHLVFLFMFDLHSQIHRKNPFGVIRAFRQAFRADDPATLVIKTSGGDLHQRDLADLREVARGDNIILIDEMVSRSASYGMIAMCDCFVSLHRSEGFGLGLAEAMLMAKPVIATGYSGNLDFMNRENSLLVDFEIAEITEDRPLYTKSNFWAEPSLEHAAFYMRHIYENPQEANLRAARAAPEIREKLSLEAAGRRMLARLRQIVAS